MRAKRAQCQSRLSLIQQEKGGEIVLKQNLSLRTPTNSFTWRFCMRCSSSRCSLALSPPSLFEMGQLNYSEVVDVSIAYT